MYNNYKLLFIQKLFALFNLDLINARLLIAEISFRTCNIFFCIIIY